MYKASVHRGMNRRDVACRVRCDVSDWNQQNIERNARWGILW